MDYCQKPTNNTAQPVFLLYNYLFKKKHVFFGRSFFLKKKHVFLKKNEGKKNDLHLYSRYKSSSLDMPSTITVVKSLLLILCIVIVLLF